jgi:hypothetical protein
MWTYIIIIKCGIPSPEIDVRAGEQASAEYLLGSFLVVCGNVRFNILLPVLHLYANSSLSSGGLAKGW